MTQRTQRGGQPCGTGELRLGLAQRLFGPPALGDVHDDADEFELAQRVAPPAELRLALPEQRADQALERLCEGRIGNVALVLVELARGEEPARRDELLVQLVDHGGLADAGIAGHEHHLGRALRDDAVERRQQDVDLALAPVELLGDEQPVRRVLGAERKRLDLTGGLQVREAPPQIECEPDGRLVAVLGGLGHELQHDGGELGRHRAHSLARRNRSPRDVAVHPLHRIAGGEGEGSGEHFEEGDSQRIEVAARIDGAVHPPGLFRRHVGERAGDHLRRRGRLVLARQP